jgi:UDP-N-acetylglucosamine--N-acetylmuramyl-(pentapeptide) pyrophosphoryl-undecaprenol N-acetylglucosamine transferase
VTANSKIRLVVTGGGTGGHTYPALTTIREVRRIVEARAAGGAPHELEILWVGTAAGLEAKVAPAQGIRFKALVTGKVRRGRSAAALLRNVVDMVKVPLGVVQAVGYMLKERPDVVFSVGGYVSVPMGVAAWLTRRPLVMHEQILTLGLANKLLARFATVVALSNESSLGSLPARAKRRAVVTGNPIRAELLTGDREAALRRFDLDGDEPVVYVTGGAQGSAQINDLISAILPELLAHSQVIHQCGAASAQRMREAADALPDKLRARYVLLEYINDEMPDVLAAADLVVSRSGAGTLAELTAVGLVPVLVPLVPTGGDEQRRNARRMVEAGAGRMLSGGDATPERLLAELLELLGDPRQRTRMADSSRALGRPHAANTVATLLLGQTRFGSAAS